MCLIINTPSTNRGYVIKKNFSTLRGTSQSTSVANFLICYFPTATENVIYGKGHMNRACSRLVLKTWLHFTYLTILHYMGFASYSKS